jgi:hypothetical protein
MATITFHCTSCQQELKVGADKAGKKAKCGKCGTALMVPPADGQEDGLVAQDAPAPNLRKPDTDQEEDGGLTYGLKEIAKNPELMKGEKPPAPQAQGPGRIIKKKKALIKDGVEWRKVGIGTRIIAAGLFLWVLAFLLSKIPVVAGLIAGPAYAAAADERLIVNPNSTKEPDLDLPNFGFGLVSSSALATSMLWVARISQVLYLLMYLVLVAGYVVCLVVPNRYGTKMQVGLLIGLAGINALFGLVFKLLPMFGLWEWTIMPLVAPEIAMGVMNQERMETALNFWSPVPALDVIISIMVLFLQYFEPVLIAIFLRGCAISMKLPDLDETAQSLMKLGLGQCFIQVAWILCAICGTSQVLLIVLRILYALGVGFFLLQMGWLIFTLLSVPGLVEQQLGDDAATVGEEEDEEDEEEEEEDEDEDEPTVTSKRKKSRHDDEDDD